MNLVVGDKVLVITNNYDYEYKDLLFVPAMNKYTHKIMTIGTVNTIDKEYYMVEDECGWCWNEDWLMKVGV